MSDIDLVPGRIHRRRRLRHWLFGASIVFLALVVTIIGARAFLAFRIASFDRDIQHLRVEREHAEEQQKILWELKEDSMTLRQRLDVLDGLRGGIAAIQMFRVVDESLGSDLWFKKWKFRRAGEIVVEEPSAVETGYFIILPPTNPDDPSRSWRFQTHMEIVAEASNHTALARFVRRLSDKPEIESARILGTQTRPSAESELVEFELAVVVRSSQ